MPKTKTKEEKSKNIEQKKKIKKTERKAKVIEKVEKPKKAIRYFETIGRRKTAIARVRLFTQGEKTIVVNGKSYKN